MRTRSTLRWRRPRFQDSARVVSPERFATVDHNAGVFFEAEGGAAHTFTHASDIAYIGFGKNRLLFHGERELASGLAMLTP
jgi:hypothetical protein